MPCAVSSGTKDSTRTSLPRTVAASTRRSVFLAVVKITFPSVTVARMQFHVMRTGSTAGARMATGGQPKSSTVRHTTHQYGFLASCLSCMLDPPRVSSVSAVSCCSAARCVQQRAESIFTAPISHASDRILRQTRTSTQGNRRVS